MKELLLTLCNIPGVSGAEDKIREFILKEISPYCKAETDQNGNIICFKKGKKTPLKKVMFDAHIDEVGIIATYITSDGFIKFSTVGGIEVGTMISKSVIFENGIKGVVGLKPVHLSTEEERKNFPKADSLYIDIGASSKEEAESLVPPGTVAVFESKPTLLGEDRVMARAIDDRAGVAVLINLLKSEAEFDFYATFTVQEEVGTRGAKTAAFTVNPDYAVVLEATTAADLHGAAEDKTVCHLGGGPAISFMDNGTLYSKKLYETAINSGICCQTKTLVAGGNNSRAISLSGSGVEVVAVSLPCRYIHSPSCVADLGDLENTLLLAKYLLLKLANGINL